MSRRLVAGLITGITVPVLMAGSASSAFAADGTHPLKAAKHTAQADITKRLHTLNDDARKVSRSSTLTADHRNALSSIFSADAAALRGLRTQVASETTLAAVQADIKSTFALRVYALLSPQVATVTGGDNIVASASRVTAGSSTILTPTTYEQAELAHAQTLLADATKIGADASDVALSLHPADLTEGITPVALVEAHSSLSAASNDIAAAKRLIRSIREHNADS
jgi:hypothetical protein